MLPAHFWVPSGIKDYSYLNRKKAVTWEQITDVAFRLGVEGDAARQLLFDSLFMIHWEPDIVRYPELGLSYFKQYILTDSALLVREWLSYMGMQANRDLHRVHSEMQNRSKDRVRYVRYLRTPRRGEEYGIDAFLQRFEEMSRLTRNFYLLERGVGGIKNTGLYLNRQNPDHSRLILMEFNNYLRRAHNSLLDRHRSDEGRALLDEIGFS